MSLGGLATLVLLPPLNMMVAAVAGAVLRRRWLLTVGLAGLVLFSLPIVSGCLVWAVERGVDAPAPPDFAPGAIVILSGDQQAIWAGSDTSWRVGLLTLEREQVGARLAKATHLPVLVTGGRIHPWSRPLSAIMAESMATDFAVPVKWQEPLSQDTWENARHSAAILRPAGITRVYVVTQAWHMRRALLAFRRAGLDAIAAPVPIDAVPQWHAYSFVPSMHAWGESYYAVHELVGWAWYELRH